MALFKTTCRSTVRDALKPPRSPGRDDHRPSSLKPSFHCPSLVKPYRVLKPHLFPAAKRDTLAMTTFFFRRYCR